MSVSAYSAVLQNLKTGRITAELPVSSAKASQALNAPGSVGVSLPLGAAGSTITPADITERRNALFLLRDGVVVGEGIIETQDADVASNSLELAALGWHHYLRNLYVKQDLVWTATDQTTIAKELVGYASSKPGALQFGTSNVATSGVVRDRTYRGFERASIGKLIDDLAAVIDGFHFRYRSIRGEFGYTQEFLTQYPASGRVTNYVLDMGGNVELLGQSGDGGTMANLVDVIGSGVGDTTPIATATGDLDAGPLWEAVETYSDVSELATLQEKADRRLVLGSEPVRLPKLRIGTDVDPPLGSYLPGDRLRVRGQYGLLDLDAEYVIQQIDLTVDSDGQYVDLTTVPVGVFLS